MEVTVEGVALTATTVVVVMSSVSVSAMTGGQVVIGVPIHSSTAGTERGADRRPA